MRVDSLEGRKVAVIGLGSSGMAAARVLIRAGAGVRVMDNATSQELQVRADELTREGAEVTLGEYDLKVVEGADLVVASPGVAPTAPPLVHARARGLQIWSEVELGWRLTPCEVIAVTGTNGKTTTTSLIHHIISTAGMKAAVAGNIGFPMCDAITTVESGFIVCEVSSFQLHYSHSFRPRVAVVLNIADDHYDWHGSKESYVAAKAKVTRNQSPQDLLVFNAADESATRIARSSRARRRGFALQGETTPAGVRPAAFVSQGRIRIETAQSFVDVMEASEIRLAGAHNLQNVLAAAAVAVDIGIAPAAIRDSVRSFEGLSHRMSLVAKVAGVEYVDDSKATNPHACISAIGAYKRVILLAGGRAKGVDLTPLLDTVGNLRAVIAMGEAKDSLEELFAGRLAFARARDVEEAVRIASEMARPGDVVLLSPACSSLDQYRDYAERGSRFAQAVCSMSGGLINAGAGGSA